MNDQCAKPGDTIEITWNHLDWLGKKLTVVERPTGSISANKKGEAWFKRGGGYLFFEKEDYVILKRGSPQVSSDVDIDESLKRQRDANLAGIFG